VGTALTRLCPPYAGAHLAKQAFTPDIIPTAPEFDSHLGFPNQ
jgi:hypothetical protein